VAKLRIMKSEDDCSKPNSSLFTFHFSLLGGVASSSDRIVAFQRAKLLQICDWDMVSDERDRREEYL